MLTNSLLKLNSILAETTGEYIFRSLTSVYAIVIYVIFLLAVIIALIFSVMRSEKNLANTVESINEAQNEQLIADLLKAQNSAKPMDKSQDEEAGEDEAAGSRFYTLCHIDEKKDTYSKAFYDNTMTLEKFCISFRNFACHKLNLYYDIEDIRRFIAGMSVSRLLVLQGMSGTGKTSLACAFGEFVENSSTVIPVQPMWKERTDLIGYYNEFTKRFNETTLLEKMYEANYSKDIYITVLDEMNIARVEYYFAEFLSLLELPDPNKRYLDVVSDVWDSDPENLLEGRIKLPENMWFIGTANNDDSTFAISDKVYDRAMVLNLDSKTEPFNAPMTGPTHLSFKKFTELIENAKQEFSLTKRNLRRLEKLDAYMIKHFHVTFGNRIMKQIKTYIPIYVACGGDELDALDDIISKKVLRKLETQNPIYVKNASEGFKNCLDDLFGYDRMRLCKAFMERLEKNI